MYAPNCIIVEKGPLCATCIVLGDSMKRSIGFLLSQLSVHYMYNTSECLLVHKDLQLLFLALTHDCISRMWTSFGTVLSSCVPPNRAARCRSILVREHAARGDGSAPVAGGDFQESENRIISNDIPNLHKQY